MTNTLNRIAFNLRYFLFKYLELDTFTSARKIEAETIRVEAASPQDRKAIITSPAYPFGAITEIETLKNMGVGERLIIPDNLEKYFD